MVMARQNTGMASECHGADRKLQCHNDLTLLPIEELRRGKRAVLNGFLPKHVVDIKDVAGKGFCRLHWRSALIILARGCDVTAQKGG